MKENDKPVIKLSYLLERCRDKSVNQIEPKIFIDVDCEVLFEKIENE